MATTTTKLALTKPATTENKQVSVINSNSDKIDTAIGVQWVSDGSLPAYSFHGAEFKELTSGNEFVLKSDGLGGFTKIARQSSWVGTFSRLIKSAPLTGAVGVATNAWQSITNTDASFTPDRDGFFLLRTMVDVTCPGTVTQFGVRNAGIAESQSNFTATVGRQWLSTYTLGEFKKNVASSFSVDFYSFNGGTFTVNAIQHIIQGNAVIT